MRKYATVVIGVLLVASLGGVGQAAGATTEGTLEHCEFPVTLTDATGTEITIEERPERVVTTNPSAAQTMWEIGGKEQVVGLTQYAYYLDGADPQMNVSASFGVSVEKVAGKDPDLVIAPNASAGDVEPLRNAGLTVYHLRASETIEDISEKTTTIGRLTGNCEGATDANAWMNSNVDAIREQTAGIEDRKRVLYPLGGGWVVGGGTFINTLFEIAGADNVAARNHTGYPQLSDEVVLQLDPEVLVLAKGDEALATTAPYASTTAGETNATVTLERRNLNQPAPRSVVNVVHNATRQLYPDRYEADSYITRSDAAQADEGGVTTETATATPTEGSTDSEEDMATATETATSAGDSGPGFTAAITLLAVLVGTLVATRRS